MPDVHLSCIVSSSRGPAITCNDTQKVYSQRPHRLERSLYAEVVSRRQLVHILMAALAACALASSQQQDTKPWTGTLRNSEGTPIAGAVVSLQSSKAIVAANTAQDGRFTFPALTAGEYLVSIESGHTTATSAHQIHLPGPGSMTILQVSTDGSTSLVQDSGSREGTGGEQLSGKVVSSLPLTKRDFSQLLLLAAGTMTDTSGAANFTQQFAVNGQRGTAAVFAMDGAD